METRTKEKMANASGHFSMEVILGRLEVVGWEMAPIEPQLGGGAESSEPPQGGKTWGGELTGILCKEWELASCVAGCHLAVQRVFHRLLRK